MALRASAAAKYASLAVAATGALVILGWLLDFEPLKTVLPGAVAMKVNAAVGFLAIGLALRLALFPAGTVLGKTLAGIVAGLGALTLAQYLFEIDLGIDQAIIAEHPGAVQTTHLGRPSPVTALNFLLAGLAILALDAPVLGRIRPAEYLAGLGVALSLVGVVGYAYGVAGFYNLLPSFTAIAIHTATLFVLLFLAILLARPGHFLLRTLAGDDAGGYLARRLVPAALVLPVAFEVVSGAGENAGWWESRAGDALHASLLIVTFLVLALATARVLQRVDAERRRAHAKAHDTAAYVRSVIEASLDALLMVDERGLVTDCNRGTSAITGLPKERLIGAAFAELFTEPERARQICGEVFITGAAANYPLEMRRTKGDPVDMLVSAAVYRDTAGAIGGLVAAARDVSDERRLRRALEEARDGLERTVAERTRELVDEIQARKGAEEDLRRYQQQLETMVAERTAELIAANEEVRNFAYIVSHDLRAPLVNIQGFCGELRMSVDVLARDLGEKLAGAEARRIQAVVDDIRESMAFIDTSTAKMERLISAILRLSRLGRQVLRAEPVDLREVAQTTLRTLGHDLESAGVVVEIGELPTILADRTAMEQVFGNLLSNAVRYLEPGRPGRIQVWSDSAPEGITLHVADNGRGMAEADIPKAFELFRRVGRQDTQGEGMGLAYVQALVKRLRGKISCKSAPGEGATFTIFLPAGNAADEGES